MRTLIFKNYIPLLTMNKTNADIKKVSVVMCTYNGKRFLREQLDSILAQDYPLHEIIVQDDRSTDDTWDILKSYCAAHPNLFRIYRNEEQQGFNRNFHTAMLRATGDLIAISDQDDIWFANKISQQVQTIGEADLCFSDYYTDETYTLPLKNYISPRTNFEHIIFYDCTPGHTMLLKTDFLKRIKEWDYNIFYDWWLSVHALMGNGLVKTPKALNWHRHYAGSVTTRVPKKGFYEPVPHPTWQPYVWGIFHRLHLQHKRNYQFFYRYIYQHTDRKRQPLASKLAHLMTRRNPFALLHLCLLCCKHYDKVYPGNPHGLSGRIHGFFYPMIAAYGNDLFNLEK